MILLASNEWFSNLKSNKINQYFMDYTYKIVPGIKWIWYKIKILFYTYLH